MVQDKVVFVSRHQHTVLRCGKAELPFVGCTEQTSVGTGRYVDVVGSECDSHEPGHMLVEMKPDAPDQEARSSPRARNLSWNRDGLFRRNSSANSLSCRISS